MPKALGDISTVSIFIGGCVFSFTKLYKKGTRDIFGNYRAVGLLRHSHKLLSMLVLDPVVTTGRYTGRLPLGTRLSSQRSATVDGRRPVGW